MKVHYKATGGKAVLSKQTGLEASRSVVVDTEVTSIGLKASLLYRYRHNNLSLSSQLSLKKHLCEVNLRT